MKKVFGNWWVLTGLIVLVLVMVLCVGLPLFVGFLRPMWVRALLLVLIAGTWGLVGFLRWRKASRAAKAIEAELAAPSAADEEGSAVSARMAESLAQLRSSAGKNRNYLYDRPWYVIIGPPGAGKTTALVNSGMRFPLQDRTLSGMGGTRNLDFMFADEAVLVDTAGRYTSQDSDASADAQGWKRFLELLRKYRPASPINGVLVAIGVDELLTSDRAGLDRHAAQIRRRLIELKSALEVSAPVYLLLTKADLIAGFGEFYDDLDVEGRRAVLGATLPADNARPRLDDAVTAFDELVAAQQSRQAKRLFEEVDQSRRSLILGFPAQLAGLRNRLARLVDGAFFAGDQPVGQFRGIYLTSGVQEGAPLDRILAGVASAYQSSAGQRGGSGRAYFLNRALTEVIFPEAGLVQADPAARRREQARVTTGVIGVGIAAALILVLFGVSFFKNRDFLSQLGQASAQAATLTRETGVDLVEVRDSDPDLEQSLQVLNTLRNLPQGYAAKESGEPGLLMRFGLFQSSHADAAVEAYRSGLRRILLPRLLLRTEQYMAANLGDPMSIYQPLKVYLMLGSQHPVDKATVTQWVAQDWANEQFPGPDRANVRKQLRDHLDALLEDEAGLQVDWTGRKAPLDGAVIANARAALQTLSLADRAYAVLRQKALASQGQPWRASAALAAGDAQAFANGAEVLQLEVPYLFTRGGYEKAYQVGLATIADDLKKDLWVLGSDANTAGLQSQVDQIKPGVANLYAQDYVAAWEKVASTPQPAAYFSDPAALGAFTKTPSPLKTLLMELRKNTTFKGGSSAAKGMLGEKVAASRFGRIANAVGDMAGPSIDAATEVTNHFRAVHDYVGDGKTPAPIDEFVAAVKQAGMAMQSAKMTGGGMGADAIQSQMFTAMGAVQTAAGSAPSQLQGFVASAATGGAAASTGAAQGALNDTYVKTVQPDCQLASADQYPFVGTSPADASPVNLQRVFGLGGTLDGFVTMRLLPLLDVSGPVWRWNADNPQAASFNPSTPDEFTKARLIRDMLAGGVNVRVAPKAFGASVDAVDLAVGNTRYHFERADAGGEDKPISWSIQGNLPEASVTLLSGGNKIGGVRAEGPWALFRLMDAAQKQNAGEQAFLATFGTGAQTVVFKVSLPNERNPFGRGGQWSFRCPVTL